MNRSWPASNIKFIKMVSWRCEGSHPGTVKLLFFFTRHKADVGLSRRQGRVESEGVICL
jgi:hypothetical protein